MLFAGLSGVMLRISFTRLFKKKSKNKFGKFISNLTYEHMITITEAVSRGVL